ncbi:LPXTG cell wall anchor domain-containing protein [Streptococcus suis]|nr:LPXTG cell wall anchor domain-containing protein [Streptococcus suis]NRG70627.1 LPXTG cell wall anchor domain-containing protein [Streptococcus suis]NRH07762.1 LPXTG cell wall anchor domain-containing protein [Streptococcus suis]
MSKQKVVSSLLLSTVVLGGLAFYSTTTVKAESLETDVTSVSSGDVVEKPVVSDGGESDFLAEEELEDDETLEEELNEKAEEVTEPSSPEALLQPRAVMSDSGSNDTEEIPVNDEPSDYTVEKVVKQKPELIQTSNVDYWNGDAQQREKLKKSVSVELLNAEEDQIQWKVTFDTSEWSFNVNHGGIYFILPNGLDLTRIVDNNQHDITDSFPTNINDPKNSGQEKYRFFSSKQGLDNENGFNSQWNWSAGQANPSDTVNSWKSSNRLSKIYFINQITDITKLTYTLTAKVTEPNQKSFPLVAVMKSFKYKNSGSTEVTSLGAREIFIDEIKVQKPKEEAPKTNPEPEAPSIPDKQPEETPKVPEAPKEDSPKPEAPKKEDSPAPEVPQTPTPESPKQDDVQPESPQVPEVPKQDDVQPESPQAPSAPEEQPKETPQESPTPGETQPEAPKKEEAPGQELPKPMEPKVDKPTPEVPKQEDVQPESPKSDKVETDKPMPETKKPDMKQPKVDDMPKEQKPKAEAPKAEQPQMDKPQMEAPKKDSEAPKSGKAESDKPMPETKQPDMKQPRADDMPKEQKPKAEAPKAEQPQMEAPKKDSEAPKSDKVETDKPMPETKQPDMKQPKADDMPKEQKPKADEPKAEQPQMDKPQMEAPKKDSEAPKSDKVETDKPMPETKQPDMKQPKADKPEAEKAQMPRTEGMKPESKASMMPKAEASKATLPNTGEASSAIGWLGGALATLVTGLYLFKNKKEE